MKNSFIDLFCGAGGFSLGMMMAGMKCLAGVEKDIWAASTFWYNLCLDGWSHLFLDLEDKKSVSYFEKKGNKTNPHAPFEAPSRDWENSKNPSPALTLFCTDINELDPLEMIKKIGIDVKKLGFIIGGPPCQGFSWANHKRNISDPRNNLIFRFIEYVEAIQPRGFMLENVPGILSLGKRKGDTKGPFPTWIKERANEAGYNVTYKIHDAKNYGVPQTRKRVIFWGTRKDTDLPLHLEVEKTHNYSYFDKEEKSQLSLFDEAIEKKEPYVTVFEAINDLNFPLASLNRNQARKLPLGDKHRGPNEMTEDNHMNFMSKFFVKDDFNGLFFPVEKPNLLNKENMEHYMRCINCGKFNLKIRKACHYCKKSIYLYI